MLRRPLLAQLRPLVAHLFVVVQVVVGVECRSGRLVAAVGARAPERRDQLGLLAPHRDELEEEQLDEAERGQIDQRLLVLDQALDARVHAEFVREMHHTLARSHIRTHKCS